MAGAGISESDKVVSRKFDGPPPRPVAANTENPSTLFSLLSFQCYTKKTTIPSMNTLTVQHHDSRAYLEPNFVCTILRVGDEKKAIHLGKKASI